MRPLDLGGALRMANLADPAAIPDVLLKLAVELGASDVVVYLVDFAQTTLEPLPDRSTHSELPESEAVQTTMAGRAFLDQSATVAERAEGCRVWVPIMEGSDRTGVLAVTIPTRSESAIDTCEELGLLAGHLIATQARATDVYNLHRRRRALSLAASMQWDLLPPLVLKTERMSVAGVLQPAYEVGGDCFDYALNANEFHLGIFDPLGHGIESALMAALCVGSYRHDRRESQSLGQIHRHLDEAMTASFAGSFATGQLARIDVDTGEMVWTNAGHPLPMLIRGGKVIGEVGCPPALPWGLGSVLGEGPTATEATEVLEPGDSLLFYTDGVTEAHLRGGAQFGVERLADLAGQHASNQLECEEIVRRIVGSVLEHQDDELDDDATLVLFKWHGSRINS